jgi:hypothetical protein
MTNSFIRRMPSMRAAGIQQLAIEARVFAVFRRPPLLPLVSHRVALMFRRSRSIVRSDSVPGLVPTLVVISPGSHLCPSRLSYTGHLGG